LWLRAADLTYPEPAKYGFGLAAFYRDQRSERVPAEDRIAPVSRIVDLTFERASERIVNDRMPALLAPHSTAMRSVTCVIVVGTDGHVWTSGSENAPSEDGSCGGWVVEGTRFHPLRVNGEAVRFRTTVGVAEGGTGLNQGNNLPR
jgi:hypothetical protein